MAYSLSKNFVVWYSQQMAPKFGAKGGGGVAGITWKQTLSLARASGWHLTHGPAGSSLPAYHPSMLDTAQLGALPFIAVMLGFPILAWCWIPMGRKRRAAGLAVLTMLYSGLFVWSQLRPDAIAPPLLEWAIASWIAAIPTLIVLVGFTHRDLRRAGRRLFDERFNFALLFVPAVVTVCVLGAFSLVDRDRGESEEFLVSGVADHEYLPIPPGMTMIKDSVCRRPGNMPCPIITLVVDQPIAGEEFAARIATHYEATGWRIKHTSHVVCRPVHGILRWADHCLQISPQGAAVDRMEITISTISWATS